ncbi:ATP synthase subunit a [Clostridia bacterium]|nr:ATP synthase subunit a [Clostridia bacterium]
MFDNGVYITETTCWAVIVAVCMIVVGLIGVRKLERNPRGMQAIAEFIVEIVYKFVKDNMGKGCVRFAPYIGTLFLYLLACNAVGLIGARAPTADMNFAFAMGVLVFFVIQCGSIKARGLGGYLKHFADPFPFMIPIKVIEEITFPISLSFRLFGNILAGVIIVELYMHLMGSISEKLGMIFPFMQIGTPLPVNAFFDIFEPFLQAFVFSMLTMGFVAKAVAVHGSEDEG